MELDTLYRRIDADAGGVGLPADNPIFVHGFDDPEGRYRAMPAAMVWSSDGDSWSACQAPDPDGSRAECREGGPRVDFDRATDSDEHGLSV